MTPDGMQRQHVEGIVGMSAWVCSLSLSNILSWLLFFAKKSPIHFQSCCKNSFDACDGIMSLAWTVVIHLNTVLSSSYVYLILT